MHDHIPDIELAQFASAPVSMPVNRRAAIEQATAECAQCRASLDFFSVITDAELADAELWDPTTDWSSDNPMRTYAEHITAEDSEADELLAEEKLLESPTKMAFTDLQRNKRLLTGGVVRRLNAHAHKICEDEPLDALTFADAAISVAETLSDDTYPSNAVFELRGTAWKERANALLVLGKYPAALEALTHAERAYEHLPSPGFGLSAVALVRASVMYDQDLLDEAAASAEMAEYGFSHLGQEERRIRALFLRGNINYKRGQLPTAIGLFQRVFEYGEETQNALWIARASYAIGNCELDRQNLSQAAMEFHKALVIFREIGPEWDRIATDWGLARVVLHGGDQSEAIRRLNRVAADYQQHSMITNAALVRLDIVETLLALGETGEIVNIAARLFRVFRKAGMITGALTAIAYMKETAAAGRLTPRRLDAVRTFIGRVERQPDLMFEPPPDALL
jgi:tetratricopeptide (TPR) repeat protein